MDRPEVPHSASDAATVGCPPGRADCDWRVPAGGCETDLLSDASNCGACGRACTFGDRCVEGSCVSSSAACATDTMECDGDLRSRCETRTDFDELNCGACGHRCPAGFVCDGSMCAPPSWSRATCPAGTADCFEYNAATAGCETPTAASAVNCGACGHACPYESRCVDGACAPRIAVGAPCPRGFDECDGDPTTRCDTPVTIHHDHCGACGRACGAGDLCIDGACVARPNVPRHPRSGTIVGTRRPIFRWDNAGDVTGARVEFCDSRACANVVAQWDVTGVSFRPPAELTPGLHFWRLRARTGERLAATAGPVFMFEAPAPGVYPPWDARTSRLEQPEDAGAPLGDINGDGYADFATSRGGAPATLFRYGSRDGLLDVRSADFASPGYLSLPIVGDLDGAWVGMYFYGFVGVQLSLIARTTAPTWGAPQIQSSSLGRSEVMSTAFAADFDGTGRATLGWIYTYLGPDHAFATRGAHATLLRERLDELQPLVLTCAERPFLYLNTVTVGDWNRDGYDDLRVTLDSPRTFIEILGSELGPVAPARCVDAGLAPGSGPERTCPSARTVCAWRCVDLQTDPANCGACDRGCSDGVACIGGACAP